MVINLLDITEQSATVVHVERYKICTSATRGNDWWSKDGHRLRSLSLGLIVPTASQQRNRDIKAIVQQGRVVWFAELIPLHENWGVTQRLITIAIIIMTLDSRGLDWIHSQVAGPVWLRCSFHSKWMLSVCWVAPSLHEQWLTYGECGVILDLLIYKPPPQYDLLAPESTIHRKWWVDTFVTYK